MEVAYDRICKCSEETPDQFWPNHTKKRRTNNQETDSVSSDSPFDSTTSDDRHTLRSDKALNEVTHCWRDCLWPRKDSIGGDT